MAKIKVAPMHRRWNRTTYRRVDTHLYKSYAVQQAKAARRAGHLARVVYHEPSKKWIVYQA